MESVRRHARHQLRAPQRGLVPRPQLRQQTGRVCPTPAALTGAPLDLLLLVSLLTGITSYQRCPLRRMDPQWALECLLWTWQDALPDGQQSRWKAPATL